jgi:hypothetical protein
MPLYKIFALPKNVFTENTKIEMKEEAKQLWPQRICSLQTHNDRESSCLNVNGVSMLGLPALWVLLDLKK